MKAKRMLLAAGGLSAVMLSAPLVNAVDLRPLVVARPRGTLHVVQNVPCNRVVELTTNVSGGRIEMTPAQGFDIDGDKQFTITRLTLLFTPFIVEGDCQGVRDRHDLTEIGIRLAGVVVLRASANGGQYLVRIPKEQFLIYDAIIDNAAARNAYERPSEDVTGTIDLDRATMQLHIVIATRLRFRAGCSAPGRCVIDELRDGTRTADITGTIAFPGAR